MLRSYLRRSRSSFSRRIPAVNASVYGIWAGLQRLKAAAVALTDAILPFILHLKSLVADCPRSPIGRKLTFADESTDAENTLGISTNRSNARTHRKYPICPNCLIFIRPLALDEPNEKRVDSFSTTLGGEARVDRWKRARASLMGPKGKAKLREDHSCLIP